MRKAAGSAALVLVDSAVPLRPEPALFEAMLAGWRRQQGARRLSGPLVEVFPVAQDDDVAVIDDEDVGAGDGPAGWVLAGPWCACWRGGGQSVVTSVTAARALCSSTMFLRPAMAATRAWVARLLTARGRPRAASWIERDGVVAEQRVGAAGELEVVGDVSGGLLGGHGGHGVADGDPLVQGGQDAEAEHPAQGGLADEQAGQRADRVHLGVRQEADGLELVRESAGVPRRWPAGDAAALVVLGGEQPGGLGGEGGAAVGGPPPSAVTTW